MNSNRREMIAGLPELLLTEGYDQERNTSFFFEFFTKLYIMIILFS
jgi:hypothetical protein